MSYPNNSSPLPVLTISPGTKSWDFVPPVSTSMNDGVTPVDQMEFSKSPPYFGPGVWLSGHILAIDSIDDMSIDFFMGWINKMLYRLPCPICVKHATDYLSRHPMESYRDSVDVNGVRNGMFIWTWLFHNDVNNRLGKPTVDYEDAYNMYLPKYTPDNIGDISEDNSVCILRTP